MPTYNSLSIHLRVWLCKINNENAYCKLIWTWGARLEIVGTLFKLFDYIRICIAKKEREHSCIFI